MIGGRDELKVEGLPEFTLGLVGPSQPLLGVIVSIVLWLTDRI